MIIPLMAILVSCSGETSASLINSQNGEEEQVEQSKINNAEDVTELLENYDATYDSYLEDGYSGEGLRLSKLKEAISEVHDLDNIEVDYNKLHNCVNNGVQDHKFYNQDADFSRRESSSKLTEVIKASSDLWIAKKETTTFIPGIGDSISEYALYVNSNGIIGSTPTDEPSCFQMYRTPSTELGISQLETAIKVDTGEETEVRIGSDKEFYKFDESFEFDGVMATVHGWNDPQDPGSYSFAENGERNVSIDITVENPSEEIANFNQFDLLLQDTDNSTHESIAITYVKPESPPSEILPGTKERGLIVFGVPENSEINRLNFISSDKKIIKVNLE